MGNYCIKKINLSADPVLWRRCNCFKVAQRFIFGKGKSIHILITTVIAVTIGVMGTLYCCKWLREHVCVLDVGRANQSIQQLSSTLEQLNHREGRKEEQGPRGNVTSIDEDKPSWNFKAQSKAGNSVKVPTCHGVTLQLELL